MANIDDLAFNGCRSLPVENHIRYADTFLVETVDKTLSSYHIKEGTRFIGNNAFNDCANLKSIDIHNGVTSIGSGAFLGCTSPAGTVESYRSHNVCGKFKVIEEEVIT